MLRITELDKREKREKLMERKPLGIEKAVQLVKEHYFENYGDYFNLLRIHHCKICDTVIPKGEGYQWYYWYGEERCTHRQQPWKRCNCDWYYSSHVICEGCQRLLDLFSNVDNLETSF